VTVFGADPFVVDHAVVRWACNRRAKPTHTPHTIGVHTCNRETHAARPHTMGCTHTQYGGAHTQAWLTRPTSAFVARPDLTSAFVRD
jgi:hypothetical protein